MSNENKVYTHELTVKLECDEFNNLSWLIETDNAVTRTLEVSYEELASAGAPFAALGIRVLRDLLCSGLLELALDKANNLIWKGYFERHTEVCEAASNDAAAQWLSRQAGVGPLQ